MLDWTYYASLLLLQLTGLALAVLGLPGLWLMVGALGAFAWLTTWERYVGWPAMLCVLGLALAAEVVELFAGAAGSAKAGGSKRGMVGAVVGALVGGVLLTGLIPIPIVGTVVGLCVGSFAGAFVVELGIGRQVDHSLRVGWGAAKGRFWGTVIKLCFGVAILTVVAVTAIPSGSN